MSHHDLLVKDGGYKSRKLFVVMSSIASLTVVALLSNSYPNLQTVFPTLCTAVTSLVALYLGANGALKYAYSKNLNGSQPLESATIDSTIPIGSSPINPIGPSK